MTAPLDSYLLDHRAAADAGCALAAHLADRLDDERARQVAADVAADRDTLQGLLDERGIRRSTMRRAMGGVAAAGTSAIRMLRSDRSVVVELEALAGGIVAKRSLWLALGVAGVLPRDRGATLTRRADEQLRVVEELHRQLAVEAFSLSPGAWTVGPLPPSGDPNAATGPTKAPSDNTTLMAMIECFVADGFTGDFWSEAGGTVRCDACDTVHDAGTLTVASYQRLEGASDPADMAIVVGLSCPKCAVRGTLVLTYGPAADPTDSDVLAALAPERTAG